MYRKTPILRQRWYFVEYYYLCCSSLNTSISNIKIAIDLVYQRMKCSIIAVLISMAALILSATKGRKLTYKSSDVQEELVKGWFSQVLEIKFPPGMNSFLTNLTIKLEFDAKVESIQVLFGLPQENKPRKSCHEKEKSKWTCKQVYIPIFISSTEFQ